MRILGGGDARSRTAGGAVLVVVVAWTATLLLWRDAAAGQDVSNFGLVAVSLLAGAAGLARARRQRGAIRRFWNLLAAGVLSWAAGQAAWTWYESVLGVDVPFPSPADWGYLGLPPLVAAALLSLPLAAPTLAGQVRTILDGLMVAASLLLVSWILVLDPVFRAGGDDVVSQAISLAYPLGDVIVITIVLYTWLRARQVGRRLPVSLPLVGTGLLAFAVADSGFSYLTAAGGYSSGSMIDVGWFVGFALLLLAALWPADGTGGGPAEAAASRPVTSLLPYAAFTVALLTSGLELWRTGQADGVVAWLRTALMALLVVRQVLTLRENHALTGHLERRVAERTAELGAREQRFAALVRHSSDVVSVVDRHGTVSYLSHSSRRVLGYAAEDLLGRSLCELADEQGAALLRAALERTSRRPLHVDTLTTTWRHASGRLCHVEVTITNLLDDPGVRGLVLNTRDVTDRTELEHELTRQAFTDSLTGLPNRALFAERLQRTLDAEPVAGPRVAVLFCDLDGFKTVNDTLGHGAGDALLQDVAQRLRAVVRSGDTVARLGGDEFAVLVDGYPEPAFVEAQAARINEAMRGAFVLSGQQVHVAVSIGIAHLGEGTADAEQLLRNSDLAMYQAKAARSGGYAVYHPGLHDGLVERVGMERDLRRALDEEQLVLHYQPIVSMRSGAITGVEALVRWQHPARGLVPPAEFIPLAEASGLIRPLGAWVLREACRQAVRWERGPGAGPPLRMSVNVSARQLGDSELTLAVAAALAETGLEPGRLTLEVTESVLVERSDEALGTLLELHALGVRIAIDDFGTGYSSLSYLHLFPVDVLKIDRSFVERLSTGGDSALVSTILRLGHSMRLETVAEGIERSEEMLALRRQGCTSGQGYYFFRPVPAADIQGLLLEQDRPAVVEPAPA